MMNQKSTTTKNTTESITLQSILLQRITKNFASEKDICSDKAYEDSENVVVKKNGMKSKSVVLVIPLISALFKLKYM